MFSWIKKKLLNKIVINISRPPEHLTEFALSAEALKHSQSYSELLSMYVKSTKRTAIIKDILKVFFFICTMGMLIGLVVFFYLVLQYAFNFFGNTSDGSEISFEDILSVATVIIPSITSLIIAFIKIPEIIAKYLFNIQEDAYMNSIIKNIQVHDQSMFAMEHKVNLTLAENKTNCEDDNFEISPVQHIQDDSDEEKTA